MKQMDQSPYGITVGRKKPQAEMSEQEKLRIKIKELEAKNYRLEAENAFLKKLEEIERRRY